MNTASRFLANQDDFFNYLYWRPLLGMGISCIMVITNYVPRFFQKLQFLAPSCDLFITPDIKHRTSSNSRRDKEGGTSVSAKCLPYIGVA